MLDRKVRVVALDVDGTLVTPSMWRRMHEAYGLSEDTERAWGQEYHDKKISYVDWMNRISAFYRTRPLSRKETEAIHRTFEFQPHVEEVIATLKGRYELALISSSQEDYVQAVAERLGIKRVYAFSYDEFDEQDRFVSIRFKTEQGEELAKVDALKDLESKLNCKNTEIVFVGDSRNDIGAFKHCQNGVLVGEGNEDLRKAAWKQVSSLDELLTFL